jgi:acyl-CoA thioester hydrolase
MPRVKIELPIIFQFQTEIKVRISDINYGGHLGNDSVLSIIHEARFQFFNSLGYKDELSIEGFGTIQADVAIAYKGEAFHGETIKVQIAVDEISRKSFDLIYLLSTPQKEIARAKTGIAMFDYSENKVVSLTGVFLSKIQT